MNKENRINQKRKYKPQQRRMYQAQPATSAGPTNRQTPHKAGKFVRPEAAQEQSNPRILKVCTLSGTNEVGRNANFLELGKDILMVDCGLAFPTNELYGIDYVTPNINYLREKKNNVRGILLTHGHLDHIGALPYVLPQLGFPTIYAHKVTLDVVRDRLAEFGQEKTARLVAVDENTKLNLGIFKVSFIHVTHSLPGCFSLFIESPRGNVFFSGDYKIDKKPVIEEQSNYSRLASLKGRIDLALMESTRAPFPGHSKTEFDLQETFTRLISKAKGRVVVASFASNISRMYISGVVAKRTGRKVFMSGRSTIKMFDIAKKHGYLRGMENLFLPETQVNKYKDSQVMFVCTGSQGEKYGALNRISMNEHKYFKLKRGDLVIRSSSNIPGNELEIDNMTSRIVGLGADLVNDKIEEIHYGGHGSMEDMKYMYDLIKPRNVIPVHGHMTLRYFNKINHINWGMNENNVMLTEDGAVWSTSDGRAWKRTQTLDAKPVLIDGLGIGDIGDAVLKDRQQLSEFGMVVTILNLSSQKKEIIGRPKFVSRGFVYVKTSEQLMRELEQMVIQIHKEWKEESRRAGRFEYTKLSKDIEKRLGKHIYTKTEREPMLLTHII